MACRPCRWPGCCPGPGRCEPWSSTSTPAGWTSSPSARPPLAGRRPTSPWPSSRPTCAPPLLALLSRGGTRSSGQLSGQVLDGQRARRQALPGHALGQALQEGVHRGGHALQPAQEDDLAVEVVGLDGARAPGQALPGRAAGPAPSLDGAQAQEVAPPGQVLLAGREVDAGGAQALLALGPGPLEEVAASSF